MGYKLREWKASTDAKYRFIGKEHDNETSYDYFGARYYDSRIGRWGQMEPKYDAYLSITPYLYSGNSPIVVRDPNGKDAEVKLEGNKAHINVTILYLSNREDAMGSDNSYAISDHNATKYAGYIADAQKEWNQAYTSSGAQWEHNGICYTPVFTFQFKEIKTKQEYDDFVNVMYNPSSIENGQNYFMETGNMSANPSVNMNKLTFLTPSEMKNRKMRKHWASHEIGHLMGLQHHLVDGSEYNNEDVMAYGKTHSQHAPPGQTTLIKMYMQLDKRGDFDRTNLRGAYKQKE